MSVPNENSHLKVYPKEEERSRRSSSIQHNKPETGSAIKHAILESEANKLCKEVLTTQHNVNKSAKQMAEDLAGLSRSMFRELTTDNLLLMSINDLSTLELRINQPTNVSSSSYYINYIHSLTQAVAKNCPLFESEQIYFKEKNVPIYGLQTSDLAVSDKNSVYAAMHFWIQVLDELNKQSDDFTANIIFEVVVRNRMANESLDSAIHKDFENYKLQYPKDGLIFESLLQQSKAISLIDNHKALEKLCYNTEGNIPSSDLLRKVITVNSKDTAINTEDLTLQHLSLKSNYYKLATKKLASEILLVKNKNSEEYITKNNELKTLYKEAIDVEFRRDEVCKNLISKSEFSDFVRLNVTRHAILERHKDLLIGYGLNLTALSNICKTSTDTTKLVNPMEKVIHENSIRVGQVSAAVNEFDASEKNAKLLGRVTSYINTCLELGVAVATNKFVIDDKLCGRYKKLRDDITKFQAEHQSNSSLCNVLSKLITRIDTNCCDAINREILRLNDDYDKFKRQIHCDNLQQIKLASQGIHAVRERAAQLIIIANENPGILSTNSADPAIVKLHDNLTKLQNSIATKLEPQSVASTPPQESVISSDMSLPRMRR